MAAPHGVGDLSEAHKRKRDTDDNLGPASHSNRIPQPPPPQSGSTTIINYLSRADAGSQLHLIRGDADTFSDVLSLISDYEGVLSRRESLAANLGAKLTAPRLLRAMEGLFEGGITVHSPGPYTPTWLDIVTHAHSSPSEFNLRTTTDGRRVCQFVLNNCHVEISEDDWRLIVSGALDRFSLVPPHPLEEDELVELATVEILEQRLQVLIMMADEVARKARQLNYHLSGRKAGINARRSASNPQSPSRRGTTSPPSRASAPARAYDIRADLLQQFLASPTSPGTSTQVKHPVSVNAVLGTPPPPPPPPQSTNTATAMGPRPPPSSTSRAPVPSARPSPTPMLEPITPREAAIGTTDDPSLAHRGLIQARIDKLPRGDAIVPPCDRCRRLRTACIKHLTSCQGCTKKHAKCSWKWVTEDEAALLRTELLSQASMPSGGGDDLEESSASRPFAIREGLDRMPQSMDEASQRPSWLEEGPFTRSLYRRGSRDAYSLPRSPELGQPRRHAPERDEMDLDVVIREDKGKAVDRSHPVPWSNSSILSQAGLVSSSIASINESHGRGPESGSGNAAP